MSELEPMVRALVRSLSSELADLDVDAPLREAGLTSLQLILLIDRIEQHFGVELRDDDLVDRNFSTLRALIDMLLRRR